MKIRSTGTSALLAAFFVVSIVALNAADDKTKAPKKGDQKQEPAAASSAKPAEKAKAPQKTDEVDEDPNLIKFEASPAAVQKTFKEETKGGKIETLGKGVNLSGFTFFKAVVGIGKNDYEVAVAENGLLLEKILKSDEKEMTLEECPALVQKAVKEEVKGGKIEAVNKVVEGKRSDYIFDVFVQKMKYQIIIMEDGTTMSKVVDYDTIKAPESAK